MGKIDGQSMRIPLNLNIYDAKKARIEEQETEGDCPNKMFKSFA